MVELLWTACTALENNQHPLTKYNVTVMVQVVCLRCGSFDFSHSPVFRLLNSDLLSLGTDKN